MLSIIFLLPALVLGAYSQILVQSGVSYSHPSVIATQAWENQFHPELLKSNQFYGNPRTAARLAQDSWFTEKEHPVFEREAEKIERHQIGKIFANAGLQRRRRQAGAIPFIKTNEKITY